MIERVYMACSARDEKSRQWGPFKTAEEAEYWMLKLGWEWVFVRTDIIDNESKTVLDTKKRFYQPHHYQPPQTGHTPTYASMSSSGSLSVGYSSSSSAEELRRELSTPDVRPLTEEEVAFFARYEKQMREFVVNGGERRSAFWRPFNGKG